MVKFEKLWKNHPTITGDNDPCSKNGKSNFGNQCAIRVGVALRQCGVDTTKIPGAEHCWYHNKKEGHILRAEQLANGLMKKYIHGIQEAKILEPKNYKQLISGKTGIIFFKDYWPREINGKKESFQNRSGDHIDLWNGSRITDWKTWVRIQLGVVAPPFWYDLEKSKQIIFWQVNK